MRMGCGSGWSSLHKSEKWNGMYIDLLPGSQVDSSTIIKVQIEQPPEPMVCVCVCVCACVRACVCEYYFILH